MRATPENRRKALRFLDGVTTGGTTDPVPALELAFRQRPQLVYLLTDGNFADNAAVARRIDQLNAGRMTRVNTIAFVGDDDTDREFLDTLQQIAGDNGGTFRHVRESELRE